MKKKTILLLLILTGILPIACCPEVVEISYILELKQVTLKSENFVNGKSNNYDILLPDDSYTEDTLILSIEFDYSFAKNSNNFSLQPSALATTCPDSPFLKDLKDKIKDISFTSDKSFNGIQAGENLNSKIITYKDPYYYYKEPISIKEMIVIANSISGEHLMNYRALKTFALTEKPTIAQEYSFTVTIEYESGKKQVVESSPIIWE